MFTLLPDSEKLRVTEIDLVLCERLVKMEQSIRSPAAEWKLFPK